MNALRSIAVLTCAVSAASPGVVAAKGEKVELVLPVIVEAPAEPSSRVYSFKRGEFWGGQPARYRSAVTLGAPVALPELGGGVALPAGKMLFELQARSRETSGAFYCTGRPPSKKLLGLLCLFDRNADGRMDELWTVIGELNTLVPIPPALLVRSIAPVPVSPVEDKASLALQLGFQVSGSNPIVGAHHFYMMLSSDGEGGHVVISSKISVTVGNLPNVFEVGDAQISLEGYENKTYRARVTRPYIPGERSIAGRMPTRTIYVSIPR